MGDVKIKKVFYNKIRGLENSWSSDLMDKRHIPLCPFFL